MIETYIPKPAFKMEIFQKLFAAAEQTLAECQLLDGSYPPEMSELHRLVSQIKKGE